MFLTRNINVFASDRDAIRLLLQRFRRECRFSRKYREARHRTIRLMLKEHHRNREEYYFVMGHHQ